MLGDLKLKCMVFPNCQTSNFVPKFETTGTEKGEMRAICLVPMSRKCGD